MLTTVESVNKLLDEVQAHPMCQTLRSLPGRYLVIFPPGYDLDGCQAWYKPNGTKSAALQRLLDAMEKTWAEHVSYAG